MEKKTKLLKKAVRTEAVLNKATAAADNFVLTQQTLPRHRMGYFAPSHEACSPDDSG